MYPQPSSANPIAAAVDWLEGTLLGSVATAAAVVAIAAVGFLMLSGRIDVRRAVQVVLGCFMIFGATTIATGIQGALADHDHEQFETDSAALPPAPPPPSAYPQAKRVTDPYAGAAVPTR